MSDFQIAGALFVTFFIIMYGFYRFTKDGEVEDKQESESNSNFDGDYYNPNTKDKNDGDWL